MDHRACLMQEHPYRMKVAINSKGYYCDPDLPYMPTFESNNFSLIFKPKTPASKEESICQVTVSASMHAPIAGTIALEPPAGVSLDQKTWDVGLKPGEIAVKNVRISGILAQKALLRGTLKESKTSVVYRTQVPVYKTSTSFKTPEANAIKLPAAKFSKSERGNAMVAMGRPLAPDGCMIAWDNAGHKIIWNIQAPKAGAYRILAQIASVADCKRRLTVNEKDMGDFAFAATGGKGETADEWNLTTLKKDEKPVLLDLNSGENTITLDNIDGDMINFAYLYLEPAE